MTFFDGEGNGFLQSICLGREITLFQWKESLLQLSGI